ncbi:Mediator of RNA polymerase II transcription subunit 24 [Oryzias melastigma]|uniref:Mediator of RNA polymerase II transcription subunit 24 n=1 Tax=Oryzias melastigma TaxID=30732 RepID=A0A834FIL6_ORYME|nr:Mediator of RNA polymerase II transcription subunit 24 [Oryzias melastigma]
MKVVNLKQAILQAWKERWTDYQWAVNIKKNFPKGATWDYLNLAEALMEQALIGPSPNPLILSYLKYAISSQMVSYASVLTAISKFHDFSRDLCVKSLLDIMDMFCGRLSCHGKAEECIGLCRALLGVVVWLLQACAWYCENLRELGPAPNIEAILRTCQERLQTLMNSTKNRALVHIARLEDQGSWSNVEQAMLKVTEGLGNVPNQTLRTSLEESLFLVKSIPSMLSVQCELPVRASFPSVHAFIMLEATMNLIGEIQPLVEQLMMIKRMQKIPTPLFVLEIWKACFTGLIESPEGTEELKWTAFTFLKIPQVLLRLKKYPQGDQGQDFMDDVNVAFQYLLKLTPLLDKADQRCTCDCLSMLLQECNKLGLLSDSNTTSLTSKRESAPRLKTGDNANKQPNPVLILRAEPTVTNILKTVDADHSKSPEGLLGVLGHMLSGKSLDLLLAAAAATGKLKSFARKFIKLNEFPKHISGEGSKSASVRALLFDISFLMLCHVVQTYGSEVVLSEPSPMGETPFFETWLQTCMPEEGKTLNPDHPCFRPEPGKVESLVTLLNNSSEMRLVQVKWHEICISIPAGYSGNSQCMGERFAVSGGRAEYYRQHQREGLQHGHLCRGLVGGPRQDAGKR